MPDGTVDVNAFERKDLKTLLPDGFVNIRPLPFGMKLERRSKATKMMMRMPNTPKGGEKVEQSYEVETMDQMTVAYDFAYCIVDHNITDKNGTKLDFANPMTLKILNPKVGSEIERYITELNEEEDEETIEDFMARSTTSSGNEITSSQTGGNVSPITPSGDAAQT